MNAPASSPTPGVPRWLWLWFPPLLALVVFPLKAWAPTLCARWIEGELGLIELATPVLGLGALYVGVRVLIRAWGRITRAAWIWIALVTLGALYFAGEELSWGQQLWQWETPAVVAQFNDQSETNLHNVSSWFDQKPRLLLELWVLIGGIIVPLRRVFAPPQAVAASQDDFWHWFWPATICLPTAVLAILAHLPERLKKWFDLATLPLELRFSEVQEYYFALFMLIYLLGANAALHSVARTSRHKTSP